jgi:ATP-binding cassette subfamily C (CFTR/MRP) protein 1
VQVAYGTLTLSPVIVFGVYAAIVQAKSGSFDASTLFTSLILISLLASPLVRILQIVPSFGAAWGCFLRLEEYLEKEDRDDQRLDNSGRKVGPDGESGHDTLIPSCNSGSGKIENPEKLLQNSNSAIHIRDADFGFSDTPQLKNINLEVRKGEHVVITGQVGCGKSLLLQAILGEVRSLYGTLRLETCQIGYCGQTPWLENLTVSDNLTRCLPEDPAWRKRLISACVWDDLIEKEDSYGPIGSGGSKLSGGERQRLVCKPNSMILTSLQRTNTTWHMKAGD